MLTGCGHSSLDTSKAMSNSKLHLKNELSYEVGCLHGVSYPYRLHIQSFQVDVVSMLKVIQSNKSAIISRKS